MAITHSQDKDGNRAVTHVGLVLGSGGEHYNSSMDVSSFYALVWNVEKQDTERICYGSNWDSNSHGSYTVDATPEVQAAYEALVAKLAAQRRLADEEREFNRIEKGKLIQVVKGRKVPKGTRGQVFWVGSNQWGESCGIITATGEKHFTALTNVRVVVASPEETEQVSAMQAASLAKWKEANPRPTSGWKPYRTSFRALRNVAAGY